MYGEASSVRHGSGTGQRSKGRWSGLDLRSVREHNCGHPSPNTPSLRLYWSRTMSQQPVVHIVHRGGYLQCTSYLIVGAEGAVLVDPGSGSLEGEVIEGIRLAGLGVGDVSHMLLTHCHVDHARGAYRFLEHGAEIVASPDTARILREGGHQVWYEYPDHVIPTAVSVTPGDGEVLEFGGMEIKTVHTPGHTPGCASFLVETDRGLTAFIGDLLFGPQGLPGWAGSEGFSLEATISSIEKLIALESAHIFCGHGVVEGPATQWLRAALEQGRSGQWPLHDEPHPQNRPPESFAKRDDA